MANANPERVYNARNITEYAEITNYASTTRTNANNNSIGIQTTCLVCNTDGVPTAYNDTANTAYVYDDTIINTGFKPNLDVYSIEEKITGELQDFGSELNPDVDFNVGISDFTYSNQYKWDEAGYLEKYLTAVGDTGATLADVLTSGIQVYVSFVVSEISGTPSLTMNSNTGAADYLLLSDIDEYSSNFSGTTSITFSSTGRYWLKVTPTSLFSIGFRAGTGALFKIDSFSVKELTTKTQRTETRLLTHDEGVLGSEQGQALTLYSGISGTGNTKTWDGIDGSFYTESVTQTYEPYFGWRLGSTPTEYKYYRWEFTITVTQGTVWVEKLTYSDTKGGIPTSHNIQEELSIGSKTYVTLGYLGSSNGEIYCNLKHDASTSITMPSNCTIVSTLQEVSTQDKYYIDTALQTVTPSLPSSTTAIDLNDTAVIGYADTIERRDSKFRVLSTVVTFEELAALNNIDILASGVEILTDEFDEYLTDEYGEYLTV